MAHRVLAADAAFWRPSNQMGVLNTDLGKQLEAAALGARLWRLAPGRPARAIVTWRRRSSTSCSRGPAGCAWGRSC